jgi:hypothetical protein
VKLTAPYFHNGGKATLGAWVRARELILELGGVPSPPA